MALLEAKNVCKFFGGLKAVNDVSFQVEEGEIFGIIGPNGAGKTTLFNLLACSFPETSGEVYFRGEKISGLSPDRVAKKGLVRTFQNIKLFPQMTVEQNIAIGSHIYLKANLLDSILHTKQFKQDEQFVQEETIRLLDELGLTEYREFAAGNLPYGLQRKVEISRALATKPKILLLDEPAAGMNPNETQELSDFIKDLREKGYTIMVIEHDMKFIMNLCDRIIVLDHGSMICTGTPDVVMHDQQVIEAYFGKGFTPEVAAV